MALEQIGFSCSAHMMKKEKCVAYDILVFLLWGDSWDFLLYCGQVWFLDLSVRIKVRGVIRGNRYATNCWTPTTYTHNTDIRYKVKTNHRWTTLSLPSASSLSSTYGVIWAENWTSSSVLFLLGSCTCVPAFKVVRMRPRRSRDLKEIAVTRKWLRRKASR